MNISALSLSELKALFTEVESDLARYRFGSSSFVIISLNHLPDSHYMLNQNIIRS
jgi:hypothetical protein